VPALIERIVWGDRQQHPRADVEW